MISVLYPFVQIMSTGFLNILFYHLNQVIRMLTEKAKEQESLIADYEEREKEFQELESEAHLLRTQNESLREESMGMGKEIELLEERMEMGEKEKAEMQKNKMKLERILAEAALSMHKILKVRRQKKK